MPESGASVGARPFWSGSIAFGLVNVPVTLYVGLRSNRVRLRMVDSDGTPLRRRYYCRKDEEMLGRDEIVRGYEIDGDRYVIVEDEELEALAPEKSREIDLKRFVKLDDIDPVYFDRPYYLAPDERAAKAYRLLAHVLEKERRAGIATFVMRGREYLVAILAEQGILRAETLRFHEELRRPADVGLAESEEPDDDAVAEMAAALRGLRGEAVAEDMLTDEWSRRLRQLVRKKLRSGKDVRARPEAGADSGEGEDDEGAEIIDLMALLKSRLGEEETAGGGELAQMSKDELYERAQAMEIDGRSRMSKSELLDALRSAQG